MLMCNSFVSLLKVLEKYGFLLAYKKLQYFVKPCRSFLHPAVTFEGGSWRNTHLKQISAVDICLILIYTFKNCIDIC